MPELQSITSIRFAARSQNRQIPRPARLGSARNDALQWRRNEPNRKPTSEESFETTAMKIIFAILCTIFCSLNCVGANAAQPTSKPNVLFIAVDDLRDWMQYLGNTQVKSSNFDRLAKMGVSFTRSYAISTVCNPSRTAVLTSL